jgi:hypothetical protein
MDRNGFMHRNIFAGERGCPNATLSFPMHVMEGGLYGSNRRHLYYVRWFCPGISVPEGWAGKCIANYCHLVG